MTDIATPRWLEYLPLDEIVPAETNPKEHDLDTLRASLGRFGYTAPIELDERTGRLVSGHGRTEVLNAERAAGAAPPEGVLVDERGQWLVPVVRGWSSKSDHDAEAYLIAANRLVESGGWNERDLLTMATRLNEQSTLDGVGFDVDDLSAMAKRLEEQSRHVEFDARDRDHGELDAIPDAPAQVRTRRGDVWLLGPHRLMCGDCRDRDDVDRLFAGGKARMAFSSPPYADRRTYDESSGFEPIPPEKYVDWFDDVQANVARVLTPDGSWFVNIKEHCEDGQRVLYVKDLTLAHAREWGWLLVDELCWTKVGVPGTWPNRFKNAWEPVFHYARQTSIVFNPYANGTKSDDVIRHHPEAHFGFTRDGGMEYDGGEIPTDRGPGLALPSNVIRTAPGDGYGEHTAAFPVGLPAWFVRAYSYEGDVVFDPFSGSGTTLLAAHAESRVGFAMELSAAYVDVTCARWQRATGEQPRLERTGEPVDFGV